MRISLELIVIAIIILVVAVVALTIFGGGIGQFGMATDARSNCLNQGKWSCETSGALPDGWDTIYVFKQGEKKDWKTCADLVSGGRDCCPSTIAELPDGAGKYVKYTWVCGTAKEETPEK
ncbi:MAG: hypothetical protein JSV39_03155 [Candidatus Aenigmatarchaeota archaeon]|nr:MAG: hypothetical protein JSV39_03155 [Candidatus Aenigmarchaeota archaeon]